MAPLLFSIAASVLSAQESKRTQDPQHHAAAALGTEADAIAQCMVSCAQGANHCAMSLAEGKKEQLASMHLLMDCARICETTVALVSRQSPLAAQQLDCCASASDICATECAKQDDPKMKACAEVCKKNAVTCREACQKSGQPTQDAQHHGADTQGRVLSQPEANSIAQCMVSCAQGANHCAMGLGAGKKDQATSMHLLMDCASICNTTAALAARQCSHAARQLEICATACDNCAAECEKQDDPIMKTCAEVCRNNAVTCRGTSSPKGAPQPKPSR